MGWGWVGGGDRSVGYPLGPAGGVEGGSVGRRAAGGAREGGLGRRQQRSPGGGGAGLTPPQAGK